MWRQTVWEHGSGAESGGPLLPHDYYLRFWYGRDRDASSDYLLPLLPSYRSLSQSKMQEERAGRKVSQRGLVAEVDSVGIATEERETGRRKEYQHGRLVPFPHGHRQRRKSGYSFFIMNWKK
mmetsp:Transcript_46557/g.90962  ORF Transcript_46557/g.90962 Transcript_46557/m.90962 type:complete len:122 (+) Transcript_46557:2-367(+)